MNIKTTKNYDLAVIGSGSGLMVVEIAIEAGLSVALIEASKFGGTCLTKGCIPSKMLVYPADLIRDARDARRIGLEFADPALDWQKLSSRMWKQINYSDRMEKGLDDIEGLDVYKGFAEFLSPTELRVNLHSGAYAQFSAKKIVIASGAHSYIPPIEGLEDTGYITSETFFGEKFPAEKLWESVIIVGSGAIAAEFAHILSAFGTKVTIVARSERILKSEEEEISVFVKEQFEKVGVDVLLNSDTISASREGGRKQLLVKDKITGETKTLEAEELFIAAGVRPFTDNMAAHKAGVALDEQGWIRTDEYLRTSRKNIYAIGDANGIKYKFRHKANYEAEILINNLFTQNKARAAAYDSVPWAIFTHPQIAHLGITESEAAAMGIDYKVTRNSYKSIAAGFAMGFDVDRDAAGFAKLISDGEGKLLGVHIAGPQAAALIQPFVYLMNTNEKDMLDPIRRSMVIHPSLSELTAWAIGGL